MAESKDFEKWVLSRLNTWKSGVALEKLATAFESDGTASYKKVSDDGSVSSASTDSVGSLIKDLKKNISACNSFSESPNASATLMGQMMIQGLGYSTDALQRTIGMYEKTRKDFYKQAETDAKTIEASNVQAFQLIAGYKPLHDDLLKALEEDS